MMLNKKYLLTVFIIAIILSSFGAGFLVGKNSVFCQVCPPEEVNFSLFWEAWNLVQERYINPEKFNVEKAIYGAISGMVKSLEDPYTVFFKPEEAKKFLEDVSGEFEGVGMEVGIRKDQLQIIAPLEGSPAEEAGLRAGDKIIKIDDTLTADISIEEAVSLIRGPRGTEVTLTVFRDEWGSPKDIKIKRAIIEIPSLKWELIDNDIAYVKIYQFSEKANVEFTRTAIDILNSSAQKIILDLRNNPGGYLEISQDISGWFLEKGKIVTIQDFGGKEENKIYKANGNGRLMDYPLAILINEGSASASEILASALRDNRGVKLIGEKSFGKGSVQELETLSDNSSLKITVANWLTPNSEHITDKGLEPDFKVELTEEDYNTDKDPQLEKAIEIIKEIK